MNHRAVPAAFIHSLNVAVKSEADVDGFYAELKCSCEEYSVM